MDKLKDKVAYIYSDNLVTACDKLTPIENRASMIHDLISSYKILSNSSKIIVVESVNATEDELKSFHSSAYVDFLKKINDTEDHSEFEEEQIEYGLEYDCPVLENIFDFAKIVAGGSVSGAKLLAAKKCKRVVNWFGGWHHAQRDSASGFCYINDIVIAIQILTKVFNKVLYLDLDIHHGDGVQHAFEYSKRILTLSFHKLQPCFFPGTGKIDEIGFAAGKYFSLNVPFKEGVSDGNYLRVFNSVFPSVMKQFQPEALVVQCGSDGINGDSIGKCNLTLNAFGNCIKQVLAYDLPSLFLGGGGYNLPNTARCWTYLTSIIAGVEIPNDIPDLSEYFTEYGPTYELLIDQGLQRDHNDDEYIQTVIENIQNICQSIS